MKIAIIGLGYVGLPLAHAFSFQYKVIGYDINTQRINSLKSLNDKTLELTSEQVKECIDNQMVFSSDAESVRECNIFIVTVPTPITESRDPDLTPLEDACLMVGKYLKPEDIVIFESTVYPGATEEFCVPILVRESGLKFNIDFFCGYSPERINPGDKKHTVKKIIKVTSGSNDFAAKKINELYASIIDAGTYLAPSIKIAEAAKVIENTQRDINIAFINELAILFNKLNIDTKEVLDAASTKWNFLDFRPGLVGGHCIGVDPYYLTYKSQMVNHIPEIILAGRKLNDSMGTYIASRAVKILINKNIAVKDAKILILGITFKENCPDIRNSKVIDIFEELKDYGCKVSISDCHADEEEVKKYFKIDLIKNPKIHDYDLIILAVSHDEYRTISIGDEQLLFDVKSISAKYTERL